MVDKKLKINMPGMVASQLAAEVASAPVEEKKEVAASAPEVKEEVKTVTKKKTNTKAKVNVKKEESAASILKARAEKELKDVAMNLRVKPSVKERFEVLRKQLNYSQSDFFEVLVQLAEETLKEQQNK